MHRTACRYRSTRARAGWDFEIRGFVGLRRVLSIRGCIVLVSGLLQDFASLLQGCIDSILQGRIGFTPLGIRSYLLRVHGLASTVLTLDVSG